ncbi:MAG TPA: type I DNA topoisomerase [Planctomycetota bacterium]|nr:type I DNA topoisomerase [Planctomycetota bacterium]
MAKPLVIVESPAKARTIGQLLGRNYTVEASIGHIRDLPSSAAEIPAAQKKEKWARLGVDVEHDFEPLYVIPAEKREQVRKLKALLAKASDLYLATDEDREGEAISWHLLEVLAPKRSVTVKRLVFHEITKEAIREALDHPREVDRRLVDAQETRRIVDRLYGYEVSPLLWKKVGPRLSAGRVQSVAVRLVVERERERIRFRASEYWDIEGRFAKPGSPPSFEASLAQLDGKRVASGKDFDPETGKLKEGAEALLLDGATASQLQERLAGATFRVESVEEKPSVERPYPPFTTSTLQQEANRRFGFGARRTMTAAQRLYENGHITYMRTDSTTLSTQAISAARRLIGETYGAEYLPKEPRAYETKVRNAQEAHEAIRPAGSEFRHPDDLRDVGSDEQKVYDLVWKRTVACQMADARVKRTSVVLAASAGKQVAKFQASGKTIEFPGYIRAYVEGSDDPEAALSDRETVLPDLKEGDAVRAEELKAASHRTEPPRRLTEATLVKELEARGIGRPSTYAAILDTIVERKYVFKKGNALVPTFTAFAVVQLLEQFLAQLVDYEFTATLEDDLDRISLGEKKQLDYLRGFYNGNGRVGLKRLVEKLEDKIDPRKVCGIEIGRTKGGDRIEARVGRYGPFLSDGDTRASIPDDLPPDELTLEKAVELLAKAAEGPKKLGVDPESGLHVYLKAGRFGPYFQLGEATAESKPKMASLLPGMTPETATLENALGALSLPKTLGVDPQTSEPVLAAMGRYGPYVKSGTESRSLPEGTSPLSVTLDAAIALLRQPKPARGRFGRRIEPLKILGKTPAGAEVKLFSGRFGPYVSDGTVNASIPRGSDPDAVDLAQALDLIAARAAAGPPKKRGARRRAPAKRG